MRELGAAAIQRMVSEDTGLAQDVEHALVPAARSTDHEAAHGALLALAAVSKAVSAVRPEALDAALGVSPRLFATPGAAAVIAAACRVVATSSSHAPSRLTLLLHAATQRPEHFVHDAVAAMLGALPAYSAAAYVDEVLDTWLSLSPEAQQCAAQALGAVRLGVRDRERLELLVGIVDASVTADVDTRARAAASIPHLAACDIGKATAALACGLDDHTSDERGDVGSWVRAASATALADTLCTHPTSEARAAYVAMAGGVMERIDAVRVVACEALACVARVCPVPAADRVRQLLSGSVERYRDAHTAFSAVMPLLDVAAYRPALVATLARTIGSRSETARRDAAPALVQWAQGASCENVSAFVRALDSLAARHMRDNRLFLPVAHTTLSLMDGRVHVDFSPIFRRATAHLAQIKSVPRLLAALRLYVIEKY